MKPPRGLLRLGDERRIALRAHGGGVRVTPREGRVELALDWTPAGAARVVLGVDEARALAQLVVDAAQVAAAGAVSTGGR